MNRTFSQLKTAIENEMQLDPGLVSDAERSSYINDGLKLIGTICNLEKEVTVSPNEDGVVNIPDDVVSVIYVIWTDDSNKKLLLNPIEYQAINSSSNSPIGYIVKYNTIQLFPIPTGNGSLTIFYRYKPATLSQATDVPDIPEGWDRLLVDYGSSRSHRKNGNIAMWGLLNAEFEKGLEALRVECMQRSNARITPTVLNDERKQLKSPWDYL